MSKKLTSVLLAALGFTLAAPTQLVAQTPRYSVVPGLAKLTPAERTKAQADWLKQHPLVSERKSLQRDASPFARAITAGSRFTPTHPSAATRMAPLFAGSNVTLWGDLAYESSWTSSNKPYGYYSFGTTAPVSFTMLSAEAQDEALAHYGTSLVDGHIRSVAADLSWAAYGYVSGTVYDTDTETWETTSEELTNYTLIAQETAQAEDGTTYGVFYNSDFSARELGVADYVNQTRTTIGTVSHSYVALGVTRAGVLYGISKEGDLYKIDAGTAQETLIGSTGISLTTSSGGYYGQTGEIDPKDDTFYWYCLTGDGSCAIYTVDLQTAAVTKLADVADSQVYGMLIPAAAAADGAPAKATDLAASFTGASLSGTVTFTAPSVTYGGSALSGELTYSVSEGGTVVASGTTTAGATVTANVTVTASGLHKFIVTTTNAAGESPKATVAVWAGVDVPAAVTGLSFTVDDSNLATITWTAPTEGTHAGYIGDITYDVYRIAGTDTVEVATDLAATTVTDQLDGSALNYYTYLVYAKNDTYTSAGATSDGQLVGSAIQPDWEENFLAASSMNFFTVLDVNADSKTWSYSSSGYVRSNYSSATGNDDWLITPPIHLKADRLYKFAYTGRNQSSSWANSLEVKYGTSATPEGMTTTLAETFVPDDEATDFSYEIQVPTEGDYYFGFHDNTADPDQYYLRISSVSVKAYALLTAPDSVTALKAVPAALGECKATISFNAPTKAVDGTALSALDSIVVSRDGEVVKTFAQPATGAALSFDDVVDHNATYTYTVVAYADGNNGREAKVSAYVGVDTPEAPAVSLSDNVTNILASWPLVSGTGVHNGYVDPSKVAVSLYTVESSLFGYYVGDEVAASTAGATSVEVDFDPEDSPDGDGVQGLLQYFAAATCEGDTSSYVATGSVVVGPTLSLPFHESLNGGSIENGFAWIGYNDAAYNRDNSASWTLGTDLTVDNDGGSFQWVPYTSYGTAYTIEPGDECSVNLPKIKLNGASNPQLIFSLYSNAREKAKLKVVIVLPNGSEETVATYDLSKRAKTGWETEKVDLSAFEAERYVTIRFLGVCEGEDTYLAVDGIDVLDQYEHNIAAKSISVPTKVTAGGHGKVSASFRNMGANAAKNFDVVLFANNEPVDTVTVTDELAALASTDVVLDLPVKITAESPLSVYAKVVYAADQKADDDATETKKVKVAQPTVPTVDDLAAGGSDGNVSLTWSEPAAPDAETVTETFEDYDDFVTEFGDWTTYNGVDEDAVTGGFSNSYTAHGQGDNYAYEIFNPTTVYDDFNALESNPGFAPHGGDKFAAVPYKYSDSSYMDGDEWLISPALSGKAQTIQFYAFNVAASDGTYPESFEVLYSTNGTNVANFTKIGETLVADGTNTVNVAANWKEFNVDIPAGATYFAIHHVTSGDYAFLFGIDDVTFEKGYDGSGSTVVGYNIYRDGELIGTVDADNKNFTDEGDGGEHVYNVTVIYEDGDGNRTESAFSNSVSVATGIEAIESALNAATYDVYTLDGKAVKLGAKSLNGLQKGMYIINDKKFILK